MSPDYNSYSVPHQSLVHVLSELGFVGGMTFLFLNVLIIARACSSALGTRNGNQEIFRFLWLIGPACWLLHGQIGGITFDSSVALLWIGIAHAMLALSGATILQQPNTPR
jgi:O-antigen ligase